MTGGGGSSFARGIFLCLNLGGSRGSSATVDILMIRCLPSSEVEAGVYRMYSEAALSLRVTVDGRAAAILPEVMDSRARRVLSAVDMTADSEGRSRDLSLRSSRLARGTRSGKSRRKSQLVCRGYLVCRTTGMQSLTSSAAVHRLTLFSTVLSDGIVPHVPLPIYLESERSSGLALSTSEQRMKTHRPDQTRTDEAERLGQRTCHN